MLTDGVRWLRNKIHNDATRPGRQDACNAAYRDSRPDGAAGGREYTGGEAALVAELIGEVRNSRQVGSALSLIVRTLARLTRSQGAERGANSGRYRAIPGHV